MATKKKKSAKKASSIFHGIMAASVKGNPKPQKKENKAEWIKVFTDGVKSTITLENSKIYLRAVIEYQKTVIGNPISKDWKNDIIEAIAMEGNVPFVISVNKNDSKMLKMPLESWLSENGY